MITQIFSSFRRRGNTGLGILGRLFLTCFSFSAIMGVRNCVLVVFVLFSISSIPLCSVVPDIPSFGGYLIFRGLQEMKDAQMFPFTHLPSRSCVASTSWLWQEAMPRHAMYHTISGGNSNRSIKKEKRGPFGLSTPVPCSLNCHCLM